MRAVVMLSGGLDSATVAAIAKDRGFEVVALSFDYGQRHRHELVAAVRVAEALHIADHRIVELDLRPIGGSALTDPSLAVPKDALGGGGVPITYVPARNTIFLGIALGLAEVVSAFDIFFGANALDYSGYPDCRPAFVEAFETLANLATRSVGSADRFRVQAPLISMTKAEIIRTGLALGVDFALTHSCYDPVSDGRACGHCDACLLRRKGFEEARVTDPTRYA